MIVAGIAASPSTARRSTPHAPLVSQRPTPLRSMATGPIGSQRRRRAARWPAHVDRRPVAGENGRSAPRPSRKLKIGGLFHASACLSAQPLAATDSTDRESPRNL